MSLLRLNVLGPPEVYHDGSRLTFALRKAQALLLYLAVERGMHPRSKLAALLWPDSDPPDARRTLRNALGLLRSLLADSDSAPAQHTHLLSQGDLIGLNPQVPLELDLVVVQQAYTAAQRFSTPPSEPERAALVTQVQQALALVRGPVLDGFWLRQEAPFDAWVQQQQQQWQVRQQLLCDRLSSWQEAGGEQEQAIATLTRWLALDPLQEEAYRRLMRVHLAQGDVAAALQVYAICRARLAEELQVSPSADTVALAEHIRATQARRQGSLPARLTTADRVPSNELVAPLVARAAAFGQLVGRYQQARQGQPPAGLVVGGAGIGKTRLAGGVVAWARAQGAGGLSGRGFGMGGRPPYHPAVGGLRPRVEEENAPEDLLDDLQWVDGASLDLVRYLGRYWKGHSSRVLLLGTVRSEGLEPKSQLAAQLADLGRDLPVTRGPLQALSQAETLQLIQAIAGEGAQGTSSGGEQRHHGTAPPSTAGASPSPEWKAPLVALGDFLFAQTGGQPLYLLETLKLLREREWLVPRLAVDGTWRLELDVEMATAVAQERSRGPLLPPPGDR